MVLNEVLKAANFKTIKYQTNSDFEIKIPPNLQQCSATVGRRGCSSTWFFKLDFSKFKCKSIGRNKYYEIKFCQTFYSAPLSCIGAEEEGGGRKLLDWCRRLIRFDVNGSQRGSEGQESFLLGCFPLSCSLSLISFARSANMQPRGD